MKFLKTALILSLILGTFQTTALAQTTKDDHAGRQTIENLRKTEMQFQAARLTVLKSDRELEKTEQLYKEAKQTCAGNPGCNRLALNAYLHGAAGVATVIGALIVHNAYSKYAFEFNSRNPAIGQGHYVGRYTSYMYPIYRDATAAEVAKFRRADAKPALYAVGVALVIESAALANRQLASQDALALQKSEKQLQASVKALREQNAALYETLNFLENKTSALLAAKEALLAAQN